MDCPALSAGVVGERPRHIEVQAARKSGRRVSFFLSENERRKNHRLTNYYFYLVFGCRNAKPKVTYLRSAQLTLKELQPETYSANLSLA
jgi:hypothetical protein